MKTNHVWIVEIKFNGEGRWQPTVGCAFDKVDATLACSEWMQKNPDDSFRIVKYIACPRRNPRRPGHKKKI